MEADNWQIPESVRDNVAERPKRETSIKGQRIHMQLPMDVGSSLNLFAKLFGKLYSLDFSWWKNCHSAELIVVQEEHYLVNLTLICKLRLISCAVLLWLHQWRSGRKWSTKPCLSLPKKNQVGIFLKTINHANWTISLCAKLKCLGLPILFSGIGECGIEKLLKNSQGNQ